MRTSLWGPDGAWLGGGPATEQAPKPVPAGDKALARVGTGCLLLLGLALLVPALLFGVWTAISALSPATATAPATVVAVGPGTDEDGRARQRCYTVEYDVDRPRTHRTCDVTAAVEVGTGPESEAEEERRFAAQHPIGSTVEVLYEVDDPGRLQGGISDPEVGRTGGSPRMTAVVGSLALLFLAGAALALRAAWRVFRAAVAPRGLDRG